ncbi:hypothetical protein MNEG_14016 [Monoraphidium neglectum]|uniref:Uncharacterized protein n=1 Tax=Monoraphidium neglectum TaxID=145388 RepID=A0A0D2MFR6_9CHLO|nr:hypothetical protein MNEG_14016 [Monoraphidium neglectum]KIY93945.1 hypothetical protein MNEG_14016 [Monoraphidium neglectum]|eukprot:XP_013892965.1 hypothetical protein MNEG_14016 [Monoraphidium neglectum]
MRASLAQPAAQRAGSRGHARSCNVRCNATRRDSLLALGGAAVLSSGLVVPAAAPLAASAAQPSNGAYAFNLPQNLNYPGLRTLLEKYRPDGFEVAAVSCNQFGGQAPGTDEEEREAAYRKFGTRDFEVYDHILVNGALTVCGRTRAP